MADECGTYLDMSVMKDLAEEMILSQILRGERSQSCKGQGERCPGGRDSEKSVVISQRVEREKLFAVWT